MARASRRPLEDDPEYDYTVNTLSLATLATLGLVVIVGVVYAS
jgi:hypothetical protein